MSRLTIQFIVYLRVWWAKRRLRRCSVKIVHDVYPELLINVRRKTGAFKNQYEMEEYAQVRAVQLSHKRVDQLVKANPNLTGEFANTLLLNSSQLAATLVLTATSQAKRAA